MKAALPGILEEGLPFPLGTHIRDDGVNFAVFSDHAERVELCIFDEAGEARYSLHGPFGGVFHGFLKDASEGIVYGYRAYGPYAPERGHRFNANKLLLDPYARTIVGRHHWSTEHSGSNDADNAHIALRACVTAAIPSAKRPMRIADGDVTLYEIHVKGFSKTLPDIPETIRGTYAALAHPASIAHLKRLGVTTLSLLPVQYRVDEPALSERGMTNYWGYNTLGFFCVEPRLSTTPNDCHAANAEFRTMVETLHDNGLEVLLDMVYNHTPEGDERGATLSFRGLDNASWYRHDRCNTAHAENLTGCGNTLNVQHPRVTQFVLDSLRYWVEAMGVDGFRFDLAPVLGRTATDFDRNAPFFIALRQDPVLASVRLIAEPWDIGPNGYQMGNFPSGWLEWNDKFRDSVRRYWLTTTTTRGELARRFIASSDLFGRDQRRPAASVNFISVHDGFTLMDMVSYSEKHNHVNGENNRDGRSDEPCANFGVEGATQSADINALRNRVRRALVATLLLAQGTPMLCAGDEIGNSQNGNNNPYCLDNEVTWLNWNRVDTQFFDFVANVLALRKLEPLLRHNRWFTECADGSQPTISWFAPNGRAMQPVDWQSTTECAFACVISIASSDRRRLLIAFNPHAETINFTLPDGAWAIALDSSLELTNSQTIELHAPMPSRSIVVLRS
jgi:isoamylase